MYVTIRQIAKKARMSPSTVSLALSGKSAGNYRLSSQTVKRIRSIAKEMGYRPNDLAASLRTKKTATIGIITRFFQGSYFSDILQGFNEVACPSYDCLVAAHGDDADVEIRHLEVFLAKRIGGIFAQYSGESKSIEVYREISENYNLPLVLCNCGVPGLRLPVVRSDHYASIYKATKALQGLGHRCIQYIPLETTKQVDDYREQGYLSAMREAGLEESVSILRKRHVKGWDQESLRRTAGEILNHWLACQAKPTALLVSDDYLAQELLAQAENGRDIRIPEDLSLMGIGDRFTSRLPRVGLSSVAGEHEELGRKAANLLLGLIDGSSWDGKEIVLPVTVQLRKTTAPLQVKG